MEILTNDKSETQITMYVDYDFLLNNFKDAEITIKNIHIVIFKEEKDIYVNNDNYQNFFKTSVKISDIISYEEDTREDIAINKLEFDYLNYNVFYDDDALLIITIKETNHS
jgi:hypothetical protein